jgi:hypothetical protein
MGSKPLVAGGGGVRLLAERTKILNGDINLNGLGQIQMRIAGNSQLGQQRNCT